MILNYVAGLARLAQKLLTLRPRRQALEQHRAVLRRQRNTGIQMPPVMRIL